MPNLDRANQMGEIWTGPMGTVMRASCIIQVTLNNQKHLFCHGPLVNPPRNDSYWHDPGGGLTLL